MTKTGVVRIGKTPDVNGDGPCQKINPEGEPVSEEQEGHDFGLKKLAVQLSLREKTTKEKNHEILPGHHF